MGLVWPIYPTLSYPPPASSPCTQPCPAEATGSGSSQPSPCIELIVSTDSTGTSEQGNKKRKKEYVRDPPFGPLVARVPDGVHDPAREPAQAQTRRRHGVAQAGDEDGGEPGGQVLGEVGVGALRAVEPVGGRVLVGLLGGGVGVGIADSLEGEERGVPLARFSCVSLHVCSKVWWMVNIDVMA